MNQEQKKQEQEQNSTSIADVMDVVISTIDAVINTIAVEAVIETVFDLFD